MGVGTQVDSAGPPKVHERNFPRRVPRSRKKGSITKSIGGRNSTLVWQVVVPVQKDGDAERDKR